MHDIDIEAGEVKRAITRLLEVGQISDLSREELEALRSFSGSHPTPEPGDERRPLWYWIRRNFITWGPFLGGRWTRSFDLDKHFDRLLAEAGAEEVQTGEMGRMLAKVSREGLHRATRQALAMPRAEIFATQSACLLAGLAGFDDLAPKLAEIVESKDTLLSIPRDDALRALAMLGYKNLHELMGPPKDEEAAMVLLCHFERWPETLELPPLERLFQLARSYGPMLCHFPECVKRFGSLGGDLDTLLEQVDSTIDSQLPFVFAVMARGSGEVLAEFLDRFDQDDSPPDSLRWLTFLEAGAGGHHWTVPVLEAQLATVEVSFTRNETLTYAESVEMERTFSPYPDLLNIAAACIWALDVLGSGATKDLLRFAKHLRPGFRLGAALCGTDPERHHPEMDSLLDDPNPLVAGAAAVAEAFRKGDARKAFAMLMTPPIPDAFACIAFLRVAETVGIPGMGEFRTMVERFELDRAIEIFSKNPGNLTEWFQWGRSNRSQIAPPSEARIAMLASFLPDPYGAGLLEAGLLANLDDPSPFLLALGAREGPNSRLASLLLKLGMADGALHQRLGPADLPLALCLLHSLPDNSDIRALIIRSLPPDEGVASAVAYLLTSNSGFSPSFGDNDLVGAGLRYVTAAPTTHDPSARTLQGILSEGKAGSLDPAPLLSLLLSPSDRIRSMAASGILTGAKEHPEEFKDLLSLVIRDESGPVRQVLLSQLDESLFDEETRDRILIESASHPDWEVLNRAAIRMRRDDDQRFVSALLKIYRTEGFGDFSNEAAESLRRAAKHPESELLVLSVSDPGDVCREYDLHADRERFSMDRKGEALRLLLMALDGRKRQDRAEELRGRTILFSPVSEWPLPSSGAKPVTRGEFEEIAVFLKLVFVEKETDAMVAEVGSEATGELLNAFFEEEDFVIMQGMWG